MRDVHPSITTALVLVALAFPQLTGSAYYIRVGYLIGLYVIVTTGLTVVTGYAGQISLGQAGFYGIGAYTAALVMANLHWSFWPAFACALAVGGCAGVLVAIPTLRLSGDYLAMATLGFGLIVYIVALNASDLTGGANGLGGFAAPSLFGIDLSSEKDLYYLVWAIAIVVIYVTYRLMRSKVGRALVSLKTNEVAAAAMGIPVYRLKIAAFMFSGICAATAGALFAGGEGFVSPDASALSLSILFLTMVIVGGTESVTGGVIGAVVIGALPELLRSVDEYRLIIYGFVLIAASALLPRGIGGVLLRVTGARASSALRVSRWPPSFGRTTAPVGVAADRRRRDLADSGAVEESAR